MKNLRTLLRDGDPVNREPALSASDVDRMRRHVLTSDPAPRPRSWTIHVAIASTLGMVVALLSYAATRQPAPLQTDTTTRANEEATRPGERRQLQLTTPGGTRVIWVFDSNFDMR